MKKKLTFVTALALAAAIGGSSALATMPANPDLEVTQSFKGQFKLGVDFKDVLKTDSEWAVRYITELSAKGVINGYGNGEFRPSANVSQEEAITMVVRALGLDADAKALAETDIELDVQNEAQVSAWAKSYLAVAVEKGFLDAEVELSPTAKADREWVTELIVRAMGYEADAEAKMDTELTFKDAAEVEADAIGYVAVAVEKGIINGYPDQTFQPHKPVKRSELAKILCSAEHHFEYDADFQAHLKGQLRGDLKSISATDVVFTARTGAEMSYELADQYHVFIGETKAKIEDLQAGMAIRVLLNAQGEVIFLHAKNQAEAREDVEMHARGTVLSYTAPQATEQGSITVTQNRDKHQGGTKMQPDGKLSLFVAPTVNVTLNAETKTAADVKAGDRVLLDIVNDTVIGIDIMPEAGIILPE